MIRQLDFLLEASAGTGRFNLKPLRADPQPGLAAGTQLVERPPKPGGEVNVGGAGEDFAIQGEQFRVHDDHRVNTLVLAEGFEEDAIGMNGNHRVQDPTSELALAGPGIIRPDGFAECPQNEAEQRNVPGDAAMEADRAAGVGGHAQCCVFAVRLEHAGTGVVKSGDHEAFA